MKHVKMLGLAAVAVLAFAGLAGASSAAAAPTTLCKANENPCSAANTYPSGTAIEATSTAVSLQTTGSFINPKVSCTSSTVKGSTTSSGTEPLTGSISSLTFSGCTNNIDGRECTAFSSKTPYNATVTTAAPQGNGTMTVTKGSGGENPGGTFNCTSLGADCFYETSSATLTIDGGNPALATANGILLTLNSSKSSGSCPPDATWTATYTVTKPKPLFVI